MNVCFYGFAKRIENSISLKPTERIRYESRDFVRAGGGGGGPFIGTVRLRALRLAGDKQIFITNI